MAAGLELQRVSWGRRRGQGTAGWAPCPCPRGGRLSHATSARRESYAAATRRRSARIPSRRHLDEADRGLEVGHPVVEPNGRMVRRRSSIGRGLGIGLHSVIAQGPGALKPCLFPRDDQPALACRDRLPRVEAEATKVTERPNVDVSVHRPECAGRVLDNPQPAAVSQAQERLHRCGKSEQVDRKHPRQPVAVDRLLAGCRIGSVRTCSSPISTNSSRRGFERGRFASRNHLGATTGKAARADNWTARFKAVVQELVATAPSVPTKFATRRLNSATRGP